MIEKIKEYVDKMFNEVPKTKNSIELKDELIANLIEKYNDLLVQGKSEEEAYNIVVASIGDITELVDSEHGNIFTHIYEQKEKKKRAKYTAVAVMLYILSVVPVILFDLLWFRAEFGVVLMFIIIAIATGMLVYVGLSKPKYEKEDETLVEEFKEWKAQRNHKKAIESAITSALWTLVVAIYLIISFIFSLWAYSWIIFIIAAAINQIIKAVFQLRGE